MRKIFGIGLSRTGTTSCFELVKQLGIKSIHLPLSMKDIVEHDFANDTSVSARFEELDQRYPNSKFIYTIRNLNQWVASCMKWVNLESRGLFYDKLPNDAVRKWISDGDLKLYGRDYKAMKDISEDELLKAYAKRDQGIRKYFRDRPDDLLVVDLTDAKSLPFTRVVNFLEQNDLLRVPNVNSSFHPSALVQQYKNINDNLKNRDLQNESDLTKLAAAQYKLANTWHRLGKPEQAEKSYRKSIHINPDNKDAYLQLSRLLIEKDRLTEAIETLRQGVEANPNEAELHKVFINAMDEAGKLETAYRYYKLVRKGKKGIEIDREDILCCVVTRNESLRLPYFLSYYRDKGISKFFVVDNNSTDNTLSYLLKQPDVYVWQSTLSFNRANFGSAWFELLLRKFGRGHWCLIVDADELLVYPDCERKNIVQLCQELNRKGKRALNAILLDMYSEKAIRDIDYTVGQNFLEACPYFDRKFYHTKYEKSGPFKNQTCYFGGVRQRAFGDTGSYLLSKVPLIKYDLNFILAGGQHWTNRPEIEIAKESGCLLHFKFFSTFIDYAKQEAARKEHYSNALQYREYAQSISSNKALTLYDQSHSMEFRDSHQLVDLGIMKTGRTYGNHPPKVRTNEFPQIESVPANTSRPFWSVMITVYNRSKYIERALRSVLEQAPPEEEMQIDVIHDRIEGLVQDEIETIVRTVGRDRVCLYTPSERVGHPRIFDLCIQRARGHWVHILHDDDWVKSGFYDALRAGIKAEPDIGAAFSRHIHFDGAGRQRLVSRVERETPGLITDWLERIAVRCRLQFSSVIVRREVYEILGGFGEQANSAFDWDMWKRIAVHYPVWFEPRILACSAKDGNAETDRLKKSGTQIIDSLRSIEFSHSYLPDDIADQLTAKAKIQNACYALELAKRFLAEGDHAAAITNLREGLKCDQSEEVLRKLIEVLVGNKENS